MVYREGVGPVSIQGQRFVYPGPPAPPGRTLLGFLQVEFTHDLRVLAVFHPTRFLAMGPMLEGLELPAGWYVDIDVRDVDDKRVLRVAHKAPGWHSDRGRVIRGGESLAEARASGVREARAAAESWCQFREGRGINTRFCHRRAVVACDIATKLGRCAEHAGR